MSKRNKYYSFTAMADAVKKHNQNIQIDYSYNSGITPERGPNKDITILRSVVGTDYYADNLKDYKNVIYTLYGPIGDQYEHEKRYNKKLLDKNISKHIYLYEVEQITSSKKQYKWFGKYELLPNTKQILDHPGLDGKMRKIINYTLKYISRY